MTPLERLAERVPEFDPIPDTLFPGSSLSNALEAVAEYVDEMLDAIESLKYCANCVHLHEPPYLDGSPTCDEYEYAGQVGYRNHCLFTPSRWEERAAIIGP